MTVVVVGNKRSVSTKDGWCGKEEEEEEEEENYINFVQILILMTRDPMVQRICAPKV